MPTTVIILGACLSIGGFAAALLGGIAASAYPVRRRLPMTPVSMMSWGGFAFFVGSIV